MDHTDPPQPITGTPPPEAICSRCGLEPIFRSPWENGWMVTRDYSEIEVRVLAALSQDPSLCQAFKDNRQPTPPMDHTDPPHRAPAMPHQTPIRCQSCGGETQLGFSLCDGCNLDEAGAVPDPEPAGPIAVLGQRYRLIQNNAEVRNKIRVGVFEEVPEVGKPFRFLKDDGRRMVSTTEIVAVTDDGFRTATSRYTLVIKTPDPVIQP